MYMYEYIHTSSVITQYSVYKGTFCLLLDTAQRHVFYTHHHVSTCKLVIEVVREGGSRREGGGELVHNMLRMCAWRERESMCGCMLATRNFTNRLP